MFVLYNYSAYLFIICSQLSEMKLGGFFILTSLP